MFEYVIIMLAVVLFGMYKGKKAEVGFPRRSHQKKERYGVRICLSKVAFIIIEADGE